MSRWAAALLVLAAPACVGDLGATSPLPDAATCSAPVTIKASTAAVPDADGAAVVFGTVQAPDGVTVHAVYVADVSVPRIDFNFRSWSATVPADHLRAAARDAEALLTVVAFTSAGCAELASPLAVQLGDGSPSGSGIIDHEDAGADGLDAQ